MNGGALELICRGKFHYRVLESYGKQSVRNSTPSKIGESFVFKAVNSQQVEQKGSLRGPYIFKLASVGSRGTPGYWKLWGFSP